MIDYITPQFNLWPIVKTQQYNLSVYEHLAYCGDYINEDFLHRFEHLKSCSPSRLFRLAVSHQTLILQCWLREQLGTSLVFRIGRYPIRLSTLKCTFLKQQGINQLSREQITVELLKTWQEFHGAFAEYRVVTIICSHLEETQLSALCDSRDMATRNLLKLTIV